jgi:hypothetical protein
MSWKSRVINLLLYRLDPSETALLDCLSSRIDDVLLWEIAAADYGIQKEDYFTALKRIRDEQVISVPLDWVPLEVLNLTRWTEPINPYQNSGRSKRDGHLIRAFACSILLRADDPEKLPFTTEENENLIQMIASVLALEREMRESASRFLCWRILRMPPYAQEAAFFALGLLILRAALFEEGQDGSELKLLADWVVREETRVRRAVFEVEESENWLVGMTSIGLTYSGMRDATWRYVAQKVFLDPNKHFPEPSARALRAIARRLTL